MRTKQVKPVPFIDKKKLQKEYHDYMTLALIAQKARDRSLFDQYYQLAEHCLRLSNASEAYLFVVPSQSSVSAKRIVNNARFATFPVKADNQRLSFNSRDPRYTQGDQ